MLIFVYYKKVFKFAFHKIFEMSLVILVSYGLLKKCSDEHIIPNIDIKIYEIYKPSSY